MRVRPRNLLDYRVIVVSGKGGTGKTTVAASLAEAARREGRRVVLAETAQIEAIASVFEERPKPLGYAGREVRPGLRALRIEPEAALAEYLGLQIGLRGLADRVLRTETFQQLLEAVPGWRELIILGKIWHLEQKKEKSGRPTWDLIVVDAPATGHGMTFLDVPRVVQQAVRAGPLSRHASWVEALVHDHDRTLLLPVTLAESLPVSETCELIERARTDLDIGVDRIVVNAMPQSHHSPQQTKLSRILDSLPSNLEFESLPRLSVIRKLLDHTERRDDLAVHERKRVSEQCQLPVVDLPFLPGTFVLDEGGERLIESIVAEPVWPNEKSGGRAA